MASPTAYRRKYALIVGINEYRHYPLNYCINDAKDLRTALERINFIVLFKTDCNYTDFCDVINRFTEKIQHDDLVLFYFAGHGKQHDEENYLLPSDYDYDHQGYERDYIAYHAVNIKHIMKKIDDRKHRVAIYLFDCCRNSRRIRAMNMNEGLASINATRQSLIVYACASGGVVLDETPNNRNGYFMENLLKHITTPNKDIEEVIKDVADAVHLQTHGFQLLDRRSCITGKVFLVTNNNQR